MTATRALRVPTVALDDRPRGASRVCELPGCTNVHYARGWCANHYRRWARYGTTDLSTPSAEVRFFSRVEGSPDYDDCWIWVGRIQPNGYGQFSVKHKHVYAHRWAYTHLIGEIPDGLELDHLCRVRACCNPWHLDPVTRQVNTLRGLAGDVAREAAKAKVACPNGHPYEGDSFYINAQNIRVCRVCRRAKERSYYQRKRAS